MKSQPRSSPPKAQPAARARRVSFLQLAVLAQLVVLAGLVVWLATRPSAPQPQSQPSIGGVTYCRGLPRFAQAQGFSGQMIFSTSERLMKGLVLYEPNPTPGASRVYQHPSWDDAGYLGPVVVDRDGDIYVAPVPRTNLVDNPPGKQNIIYRVDRGTGEIAAFLDLSALAPPSPENPFGLLGLAYDCDTHSLYATSVAGSTRTGEVGRIFRIDLNNRAIAAQVENIDAIGVGVLNGAQGKRLYFGAARAPEVRSIALGEDGNFRGEPRQEFSIATLSGGRDEKARRINFDAGGNMLVYAVEFNFNLVATSEPPQTVYRLLYRPEQDTFELLDISPD